MIFGLGHELQDNTIYELPDSPTHELQCSTKTVIPKNNINFKVKHFFILGNQHSGTSLLRGLLNAHSKITVAFEDCPSCNVIVDKIFEKWMNNHKQLKKPEKIWGNKIPIEQIRAIPWTDDMILNIAERGYCIIWIQRRFGRFNRLNNSISQTKEWRERWEWGCSLYWKFKEKYPTKVIQVSFEDLLFQPEIELTRICSFLNVEYESEMIINGPAQTGHFAYKSNKKIDIGKI